MAMDVRRFNFFGTLINATNPVATLAFLKTYDYNKTGYVSFPDSSVVAIAEKDIELQRILNSSLLTLPDGKPSEFFARLKGYKNVSTVSGYWLCRNLFQTSLTHYFFGSTEEKLNKIIESVKHEFPSANIVGRHSPAFHDVDYFKNGNILAEALDDINRLKPDLIWVGISSPKQDFLMQSHVGKLNHGIMLGVGGVFDYLSGEVKKSPEWVKKIGLRWLWRLANEPKRLGSKYWLTIRTLTRLTAKSIFHLNN
jgi:N-acetylglucosaminyldiphosphoundecaprenol N-acetyl-beta-D-mannosaminyltransferase